MAIEYVTSAANSYYKSRYDMYTLNGFTADEAEERADLDLIEWSKPLPLPEPTDINEWFDADNEMMEV